jgi:hypothetical protein
LGFIRRQRVYLQMTLEGLLVREAFRRRTVQHLLKQIIHLIHQAIHIVVRTIPLKHGEFRVMMAPHLFITEAAAQLIHRAAPCHQQALHMVFRAGH